MSFSISRKRLIVSGLLISLIAIATVAFAQEPQKPAGQPEVIRISTELVQTGVTVFDKQGHFVEGLTPEQFELRVDGTPVKLSFFDRVMAGTVGEQKQELAASRGASATPVGANPESVVYRGRTVLFFVDDLHLSNPSVNQTRRLITDFIDNQMGVDDQVVVVSPSGQIGFLSNALTDVKAVLRAAVARINHRPYRVVDAESIPMTEYQALRVEQGDRDTTSYFVTQMLKENTFKSPGGQLGPPSGGPANAPQRQNAPQGGITPEMAERNVKNRAQLLLRQTAAIADGTLSSLESAIRQSSQLPGRKLVFFISDGFYLNDRNTGFGEKLKQITDAALRSGVVVYSLDARGIVGTTDSSSNRSDALGQLARSNTGELSSSQDPLTALAYDTGGRALLNSDALIRAVTNALQETSNYYLLAWRPPAEGQKGNFRRIEVNIVGRPELTVRLPRGFVTGEVKTAASPNKATAAPEATANANPPAKGVDADLRAAIGSTSPQSGLPTQLATSFIDIPNTGAVLNAAIQIKTASLDYGADGKQPAAVDLAGVVFNDQGKTVGGFKNRLTVNPRPAGATPEPDAGVIYNHKVPIKPGIYQVRVATREDRTGRIGSASHWIEIPDLSSKTLSLSSLLVGGQFIGSSSKQAGSGGEEQMLFSVDRRFSKGSHLSFLTVIYNARPGNAATPDLDAQIRILRGGQAVMTSPLRKLTIEPGTDTGRVPYGADIKLNTLASGRYLLRVDVNDHVANSKASQEIVFEVE